MIRALLDERINKVETEKQMKGNEGLECFFFYCDLAPSFVYECVSHRCHSHGLIPQWSSYYFV